MLFQRAFQRVRISFVVLASLVLLAAAARATSVRAPDFETLVDRADLIFTGRAISQRSEWSNLNGQRSIVTLVSFGVERLHKGKADSVVTLQFLGGSVEGVTLDVAEMPKFRAGERAVLFVENNGATASPLIGFFHGKFVLKKNGEGGDEILKQSGEALTEVAEIGRVKRASPKRAAVRPISHDEFSTKIRERLAALPHRKP